MGVAASKLDDDKALQLCRERKRLVRQALDGMCLLATAHIAYIQSLRNTGIALRKFAEPDAPVESSLGTSTSATPEPLALTDKSLSQFSYSSPSVSQRVETVEPLSAAASSPYSGRFQVNYMKTGGSSSATVEERAPVSATATLMSSSGTPQNRTPRSAETRRSFEAPPPPPPPGPWDYFGLFHPIDSQFSFQDGNALNHELESADDIQRFREEEGIPDLEEGEKVAFIMRTEYDASDDGYDDEPSDELSFRSSKRQNDRMDSYSPNASPKLRSISSINKKPDHLNGENKMPKDNMDDASESETPDVTPLKSTPLVALPADGNRGMGEEHASQNTLAPKDFLSSMKEIEYLFFKASESGNKVSRMLEANKMQYHPTVPETKAQRSRVSTIFTTCLACFEDPEHIPQEHTTNAIKYLTWHRSTSSRSSSSRIPLSTSKDNTEDSSGNLFNSFCMNSGSHASTLNRLYAWERKLYDEVKASGIIRREYDLKCKLLRQQDSKGESHYKIDKTRATVKDLHSRIRVAIHQITSISKRIEELRDKELQPQLEELIEGLSGMWEMMLKSHKLQYSIILIAYNNGSSKISIQSESHRQATIHLENELKALSASFINWIGAHKFYLVAIDSWLKKCNSHQQQKSSRGRQLHLQFSHRRFVELEPPIFIICSEWLNVVKGLEVKGVADSIKELVAVTARYLPQKDETLRKNRSSTFSSVPWKVDGSNGTVHTDRNEATVDWNSGFPGLKSSLEGFFNELKDIADSSVKKYADLRLKIEEAHSKYNDPRMHSAIV
eukprot:TRINITY_DN1743_c0_g1_i3.p1 TRINITY_DN1743_c0_g1~~TRINITY_DN1743_c0_g1_i3.p1  ORF type:complete len:785 (-),score=173.33 TRINITY_DN1743_c0_g1_i3:708-3062(-)